MTGSAVLAIGPSGPSNTTTAILGGTGRCRNVRGEVVIHPASQTLSELIFYLIP